MKRIIFTSALLVGFIFCFTEKKYKETTIIDKVTTSDRLGYPSYYFIVRDKKGNIYQRKVYFSQYFQKSVGDNYDIDVYSIF
ncbi:MULTISPECIES: hypothetical protein [Capnocytophaga]|uniref:hypothetical protein n=1 Tax=Capnocytophaga TaxID=1016 RepID=UPI0019523DFA|nr:MULTISPECIES: hypothetical protein [Capnocytophaga]GIJ95132.1 hypothetical protein CAPN002_23500 [Capnocytophaga stomatis]GJQ03913.1 hypothetical protein CAPN009_03280 [Capnocytophaga canimorsus]